MNHRDTEVRDRRPEVRSSSPPSSSPVKDYERAFGLLLHTSSITKVPWDDILSRCRKPALVWARFLAMDAIARDLGWSCAKVGTILGRSGVDVWRARKRLAAIEAAYPANQVQGREMRIILRGLASDQAQGPEIRDQRSNTELSPRELSPVLRSPAQRDEGGSFSSSCPPQPPPPLQQTNTP